MDCEQALSELEAYLDGELAEPGRAEVESHLFGCAHCFDRGEFRRRVREIVGRKCGIRADLPSGVAERIRGLIAVQGEPPRRPPG